MPATGVIDANDCQSEIYEVINQGIDLGWLEHRKECKDEDCTHDVEGWVLIGDWKRSWEWRRPTGSSGRYLVVKPYRDMSRGARRHKVWVWIENGPNGFAAIYNKDVFTVQVVRSKWVQPDARPCSPCYPGQASIGTLGGNEACYCLPPHLHHCFMCDDYKTNPNTYDEVVVWCEDGHNRCFACCRLDGFDFKTGAKK